MAEEEEGSDQIYINGFFISLRAVDSQLYLSLNGEEIVAVNMSLVTIKNLAKKLTSEIERYEEIVGIEIPDNDIVQSKIDQYNLSQKQARDAKKDSSAD